jgi:hypothetical protein
MSNKLRNVIVGACILYLGLANIIGDGTITAIVNAFVVLAGFILIITD